MKYFILILLFIFLMSILDLINSESISIIAVLMSGFTIYFNYLQKKEDREFEKVKLEEEQSFQLTKESYQKLLVKKIDIYITLSNLIIKYNNEFLKEGEEVIILENHNEIIESEAKERHEIFTQEYKNIILFIDKNSFYFKDEILDICKELKKKYILLERDYKSYIEHVAVDNTDYREAWTIFSKSIEEKSGNEYRTLLNNIQDDIKKIKNKVNI